MKRNNVKSFPIQKRFRILYTRKQQHAKLERLLHALSRSHARSLYRCALSRCAAKREERESVVVAKKGAKGNG